MIYYFRHSWRIPPRVWWGTPGGKTCQILKRRALGLWRLELLWVVQCHSASFKVRLFAIYRIEDRDTLFNEHKSILNIYVEDVRRKPERQLPWPWYIAWLAWFNRVNISSYSFRRYARYKNMHMTTYGKKENGVAKREANHQSLADEQNTVTTATEITIL